MLQDVAHANVVTVTYGKDPADMARLASIGTAGLATPWTSGTSGDDLDDAHARYYNPTRTFREVAVGQGSTAP